MQSIPKNNAAPRTTTSEEQAASKVQHKDLKICAAENTFRDKEAKAQPCLSLLYALSDAQVLRSDHSRQITGSHSRVHQMSEEDRKFAEAGRLQARRIAKDFLNFLVKFDDGIGVEDSKILCDAIRAIDRAVVVA